MIDIVWGRTRGASVGSKRRTYSTLSDNLRWGLLWFDTRHLYSFRMFVCHGCNEVYLCVRNIFLANLSEVHLFCVSFDLLHQQRVYLIYLLIFPICYFPLLACGFQENSKMSSWVEHTETAVKGTITFSTQPQEVCQVKNSEQPEADAKPKKKICCACPETKKLRDECVVENGEDACGKLIEAHKKCLRAEGFNV